MCALSRTVRRAAQTYKADLIIYDVGPNVGALNRTILLDSDYFATPVAADLFSLRALATVGRSLGLWIRDWETVRNLAPPDDREQLLRGQPEYLGYITSAYKGVLDPSMGKADQTLVLLYSKPSWVDVQELVSWVEYSTQNMFRKNILLVLHKKRLIEYDVQQHRARISPLGSKQVELQILKTRA